MWFHKILAWFLFRNEYGLSACQVANINIYLELRERTLMAAENQLLHLVVLEDWGITTLKYYYNRLTLVRR